MSTNLYYRLPAKGRELSDSLKFILKENGYFSNGNSFTADIDLIDFLKGVSAGSNDSKLKKECNELIGVIDKYDQIEIYLY